MGKEVLQGSDWRQLRVVSYKHPCSLVMWTFMVAAGTVEYKLMLGLWKLIILKVRLSVLLVVAKAQQLLCDKNKPKRNLNILKSPNGNSD